MRPSTALRYNLLGRNLPDRKVVSVALAKYRGIGLSKAKLICARLGFNRTLTVDQLSDPQINALAALLSSPTYQAPPPRSIALPEGVTLTPDEAAQVAEVDEPRSQRIPGGVKPWRDQLIGLKLDGDWQREVRANIAREYNLGTEKGRRHAAGLPVRGQRTRPNGRTARRLNKLNRHYSTRASPPSLVDSLRTRWRQLFALA